MEISVSELIVAFMERLGVTHAFGMPGAHILPVFDRLYDSRIKTVLVKHEQGAAFMAGGQARAAGRIGACVATAGPGATNLVTGIANAYAEKLPVLVVTGETPTYIFGKGGLQESSGEGGAIDQGALFGGITRYHRVIERTDYLGQVLRQAANILLAPASGPVLLSIPYNVQKEKVDAAILDGIRFTPPVCGMRSSPSLVEELASMIAASARPVIVAGHGCLRAGAQKAVRRLSERMAIPVATSLKAKGVVDEGTPLSLGCLGVTSDGRARRHIAEHADLVLFLGAGFNERTSHLWNAELLAGKQVVQVDCDPAQLDKVFTADLAIQGDVRDLLTEVLALLDQAGTPRKAAGAALPPPLPAEPKFRLVEHFYARLAERFPQDALFFDDNIVLAQSYLKVAAGNRYFPNTGISSLGHALPAAIGARFAGEAPTFAILGDGGFQMCCMELMTAVNYGLPVNVVLLNNSTMGLIRKNQVQLYRERFIACDFVNPDYGLLAQSFGIKHHRVESEADVDRLFANADLTGTINLIEILMDKNAFPSYLSER